MQNPELKKYKEYVNVQLGKILPLLQKYAMGDFSKNIKIPKKENEFTEILVGINLMAGDIKEMIKEGNERTAELSAGVNKILDAVQRVVRGDYSAQVELSGKDDKMDSLAMGLNMMIDDINDSIEKSKKSKMELEKAYRDLQEEIIERNKMKEAIQESEEKFRTISASAQDAILTMDYEGKISFWNDAATKIFGWSSKDAIGKNLHKLLAPKKYLEAYQKGFEAFQRTGKGAAVGKTLVLSALHKNGTEFPIEASLARMNLKGMWHAVGIIRDITVHKQIEEELHKTKNKAELANQAKSVFLANMSHEIRTPMNAVLGFTDMMLDTDLNKEQSDYAVTIKKSGEALLSLINDILDFSKIEAGELNLEEIDFDPELLAYDVCELIRPRIGPNSIEVLCRIGDNLPSNVRGDPVRLRQVLTNLMGNASKFTNSGEVELSLNIEEEEDNRVKLHAKVRDTGIGIPEDKLATIFEPFQQADSTTTRKYGGTGLGLSICRQISNLMSGNVWAESKVNKGSIFHFTTWLGKIPEKKAKRFAPVPLSGKKVLIVDDNQSNLDILTHTLELTGMEVTALINGKDIIPTLNKARDSQDPFALCIIDIQMPDTSGYEVAEKIRDPKYKFKDIYLIALSSLMERDARKCEKAGFDGFLSKPIHRKKLFQMVERIIGERYGEKKKTIKEKIITQYSMREDLKHSVHILLAEDNPVNQKLAKMMLTKAGYGVVVANNGKEAVEKYTKHPDDFDLIFMDVQMPEMDGMEATKIIKKKGFDTIPIVAMTAHAMKGDREMCLEAGMDDYITKPIKRELVFEMIEKWIFEKNLRLGVKEKVLGT